MITQFHVANYKALRDVTLDLTPIHVLIGPNGSGKSSILEAFELLSYSVKTSHTDITDFWPSGTILKKLRMDLIGLIALGCKLEEKGRYGEHRFKIDLTDEIGSSIYNPESLNSLDGKLLTSHQNEHDHMQVRLSILRNTIETVPKEMSEYVHRALSSLSIHRWNPHFLRMPVILSGENRFKLDRFGFGLAQCLDDLLGADRSQFDKLENEFLDMFPEFGGIQLVSEAAYQWPASSSGNPLPNAITGISGKGIHFKLANGKTIRAADVSDGTLIILGYLTLLHLPNPPRVMLIEEPENGIHPQRIKEIINLLRKLIQNHPETQILMTTHSPYLLDEFRPEEVTICSKAADGAVSVTPLSKVPSVKKQLDVFSLGEIWTAEGDDQLAKFPVEGAK